MKGNCAGVRHESVPLCLTVRTRGMEARSEPQHRTQVNLRKAGLIWVSVPPSATPDIQSWQDGIGGGGGGTLLVLTLGDLFESAKGGRAGRNVGTKLGEKSDRLTVAMKPGNAGGAKETTG